MREYKIGFYKYGVINRLKRISLIQYKILNSHEYKLQRLIAVINLLKAMEYNYQDYCVTISKLSEKYSDEVNIIPTDVDESKLKLNKCMLNILSIFRTNLDHLDSFYSSYFGSDSLERKNLKRLLSSIYDSSWVYRFIYKLRNYSQHRGVPIDYFAVNFNGKKTETERIPNLVVQFDRDILLNNFNSWSKHVINELKAREEKFDVNPILDDFINVFSQIEAFVIDMVSNELSSTEKMISNIIDVKKLRSEDLFIYWNENNKLLIVNSSLRNYKSLLNFCGLLN